MARKKETVEANNESTKTVDTKKIVNDIKKELIEEKEKILKELNDIVDKQVEFRVSIRMKEEEKKFIRGKNAKIIKRDIFIIILIAIIGYFSYCLYDIDYFNFKISESNEKVLKDEENIKSQPSKDSSFYIEKYGYLIEQMQLDESGTYEFYSLLPTVDSISNELKLKIAYKNLRDEIKENNQNLISFKADDLHISLESVLGSNISIKDSSFIYDNTKFLYYNDSYIGEEDDNSNTKLLYKIYDARETDNLLIFDVAICKVSQDNKLLDIYNNIIAEQYNDEDLSNYVNILPKYKYTFENNNGVYNYSKIESIDLTNND